MILVMILWYYYHLIIFVKEKWYAKQQNNWKNGLFLDIFFYIKTFNKTNKQYSLIDYMECK